MNAGGRVMALPPGLAQAGHTDATGVAKQEQQRMRERWLSELFRLMDSPVGAVLGGLCYGLWALFVNRGAGWPHASLIGAAHWTMSASLTYGCVSLMRRLFRVPADPRLGAMLAAGGSLVATYTLLISVHTMIGTPHILWTLAPGLPPTIAFAVTYASLLLREARRRRGWQTVGRRCERQSRQEAGHARA
jgi:hypothetical protein